jgi:hypothetical protein
MLGMVVVADVVKLELIVSVKRRVFNLFTYRKNYLVKAFGVDTFSLPTAVPFGHLHHLLHFL